MEKTVRKVKIDMKIRGTLDPMMDHLTDDEVVEMYLNMFKALDNEDDEGKTYKVTLNVDIKTKKVKA